MNKVMLIGRTVKDVESTTTTSGTVIAKFCLAVNRQFKKDETDFINCVAFGKTAEVLGQYASKGKQLGITGRIQTGSYDAQDGTKRYTTDIIIENFEFLGGAGQQQQQQQESKPSGDSFLEDLTPVDDGDMPF